MPITLKAARVNMGWNLDEGSKKLGIAKWELHAYESGKKAVPINVARNMEEVYGWELDKLKFPELLNNKKRKKITNQSN